MCQIKDLDMKAIDDESRLRLNGRGEYEVLKKTYCIKQQGFPDFVFYLNKGVNK